MPLFDPDNPLAVEIQQEMAESYFAACRKMVDSLGALKVFDAHAATAKQVDAHTSGRQELVEAAAERVYFVVIQAEAMNLSWSDGFFIDYEVPDEVRAKLGPRQQK